jgi:hypothetical protein
MERRQRGAEICQKFLGHTDSVKLEEGFMAEVSSDGEGITQSRRLLTRPVIRSVLGEMNRAISSAESW